MKSRILSNRIIQRTGIAFKITVAYARARFLGHLEKSGECLKRSLTALFLIFSFGTVLVPVTSVSGWNARSIVTSELRIMITF